MNDFFLKYIRITFSITISIGNRKSKSNRDFEKISYNNRNRNRDFEIKSNRDQIFESYRNRNRDLF